MFDAIKPLLESGLINEDIGAQLNEAWVTKLNEAKIKKCLNKKWCTQTKCNSLLNCMSVF
jgi:hypothetical protein